MTFGWIDIEPVQGKAGKRTVNFRLLSHNAGLDRQITFAGVCVDETARMTSVQLGVLEPLFAFDGALVDNSGETLTAPKTEYLPLFVLDGLLLDNTGSLINVRIN